MCLMNERKIGPLSQRQWPNWVKNVCRLTRATVPCNNSHWRWMTKKANKPQNLDYLLTCFLPRRKDLTVDLGRQKWKKYFFFTKHKLMTNVHVHFLKRLRRPIFCIMLSVISQIFKKASSLGLKQVQDK